jgi:hypothetical protein
MQLTGSVFRKVVTRPLPFSLLDGVRSLNEARPSSDHDRDRDRDAAAEKYRRL